MPRRPVEPATRIVLAALVAAVAISAALVPRGVVAGEPVPDPAEVAAVAALATLTLPERAAQVVMTSVPGSTLTLADRRRLEALRPGGIILFADNYRTRPQLTRLVAAMQVAARGGRSGAPAALVSVDQEGGVVRRFADAPPTRSHPELGRLDDVAVTRDQGRRTAVALRRLGIQMDLAPVADLDLPPRRVMRERSFGSSPALVSRHVSAFVEGLRDGEVAGAVKHFPGFGGASVNSDDALATIGRTSRQLELDLQPFRAAIDADVASVMVSHAVYEQVDRRRPASTSPAVYRMLREQLGYDGIAITDSLHAAGFAAAARSDVAGGCVRVIDAGADVALLTGTVAEAIACRNRIVAAVRSGVIDRARLDDAALRVLRLKSRLGLLER